MKLTFLEASNGLRLSKHVTSENKFRPYPHVKNFTSHEVHVPCIDSMHQEIVTRAAQGQCLLKGNLRKQLADESRAGATDRAGLTQFLALDFDGITLSTLDANSFRDIDTNKLEAMAEQLIALLPNELQHISYIAQASSSLGLKNNSVSMHIFMRLTVPMPPKTLKLWLQQINYTQQVFANQIELSANGQSLKYGLDTSVADNSKILFIAPPTFDKPEVDPFMSSDNRIVLVKKNHNAFDLGKLAHLSAQVMYDKSQKIKNELRQKVGLSKKEEKIKVMQIDNRSEEVLLNPDKMSISIADINTAPYIRCNINGGDSNAYWFNLNNPVYMNNFKGEPVFLIEKADADFYQSIFDVFEDEMKKEGRPEYPVVFRDFNTDVYWNGIFDPNLDEFTELKPTSPSSIEGFMRTHGRPTPDFVPDANMAFDPTNEGPSVDLSALPYRINTFRRTMYMLNAIAPEEPLSLGYACKIQERCPTIYTLLKHILGDGDQELERFMNWLAYIYQTKQKAKTAWVLSGVPGTGKGVFAYSVLRPLFSEDQAPVKTLENLEEQFNSYLQTALLCVVDEFHMASSAAMQKVANKLKNQITEPSVTIRKMRSNQVEVPNFTSFIFLTNHVDAVRIEPGDRRYNIAPRQERKLIEAHPELVATMDKLIPRELLHFAGALSTFKYDETLVRMPVDNNAKVMMKTASLSVFEEYCDAIRDGNIEYFSEVLDINVTDVMNSGAIDAAQRSIKLWIAQAHQNTPSIIPVDHFRNVFNVYADAKLSLHEFRKRLQRNNINIVRKRPNKSDSSKSAVRGIEINWQTDDLKVQNLINTYFKEQDNALLHAQRN